MSQLGPAIEPAVGSAEAHVALQRQMGATLVEATRDTRAQIRAATISVPAKRFRISITLDEHLHRSLKKVLLTYDDTWQTTIEGLLNLWLHANEDYESNRQNRDRPHKP